MDALSRIGTLLDWIEEARTVPFSTSVVVNRDAFADELEALRDELPGELLDARELLADRAAVLVRAEQEAERIVADAEAERQRLVEDADVYREAQRQAEDVLAQARDRARQLRLEADDYIDEKLAGFEIALHKTLATVERGRSRLARRLDPGIGGPPTDEGPPPEGGEGGGAAQGDAPGNRVAGGDDADDAQGGRTGPRGGGLYDHEAL